jgi:hypothetical protein
MTRQPMLILFNLGVMFLFLLALIQRWASPIVLALFFVLPLFLVNVWLFSQSQKQAVPRRSTTWQHNALLWGSRLYLIVTLAGILMILFGWLHWKLGIGVLVTFGMFLLLRRELKNQLTRDGPT